MFLPVHRPSQVLQLQEPSRSGMPGLPVRYRQCAIHGIHFPVCRMLQKGEYKAAICLRALSPPRPIFSCTNSTKRTLRARTPSAMSSGECTNRSRCGYSSQRWSASATVTTWASCAPEIAWRRLGFSSTACSSERVSPLFLNDFFAIHTTTSQGLFFCFQKAVTIRPVYARSTWTRGWRRHEKP